MKLLAFYTASEPGSVALLANGKERACDLPSGRQLEVLVSDARDLMRKEGVGASELDGIAVARGPGSFTGLRVAASAALGLARAKGVALYAPGTLEIWAALAFAEFSAERSCSVVLDARRGEVYVERFGRGPTGGPEALDGPRAVGLFEAASRIEEAALVVGDGRHLVGESLLDPGRLGFSRPPRPLALSMAKLVESAPSRYALGLESFAIDYFREPQAVVKNRGRAEDENR